MTEPCPGCAAERVSLKQYVDSRFDQLADLRTVTLRALDDSTRALEHRLDAMNEFRSQLQQERGEYIRQDRWDVQVASLARRLDGLEAKGEQGVRLVWLSILCSAVALMFGLVARFVLYPRP